MSFIVIELQYYELRKFVRFGFISTFVRYETVRSNQKRFVYWYDSVFI